MPKSNSVKTPVMRSIFPFAALILIAVSCKTPKEAAPATTPDTVTRIVHGTSFGHCRGYCKREEIYTPNQIVFATTAWDTAHFPKKENTAPLTPMEFDQLTAAINWEKWNTMDSIIGCPDCTDAGAEYLIITRGTQTKRVRFDANANPPGLEQALSMLRMKRKVFEKAQSTHSGE